MKLAKFDQIKEIYFQKIGQLKSKQEQIDTYNERIAYLSIKEDNTLKASLFLQSLSDNARLQVLDKISGIVTDAIQTVKDKNLEFKMTVVTKANQPVVEMGILDKTNGQTYDVLQSMGGGLADIVSITLRIALLCRWQPKLTRLIICDELGKFISVKDQEIFAAFIRKLSEALNLQMIWISHSNVLTAQAHKIFEINKLEGVSNVTQKTTLE